MQQAQLRLIRHMPRRHHIVLVCSTKTLTIASMSIFLRGFSMRFVVSAVITRSDTVVSEDEEILEH